MRADSVIDKLLREIVSCVCALLLALGVPKAELGSAPGAPCFQEPFYRQAGMATWGLEPAPQSFFLCLMVELPSKTQTCAQRAKLI